MNATAGAATVFIALLGSALIIAIVAERFRIQPSVALVALGALATSIHPIDLGFTFGDTLLFVFLPPLIFEAAWNIDPASLRTTAARIALLAIPGVVITAVVIGFGVALFGQLPLVSAVLLGAIVSATDPVAVIAVFKRLDIPNELQMIIEGESIANDGVAVIVYGIAVALASGREQFSLGGEVLHGIIAIIAGGAIGLALAFLVAAVLRPIDDAAMEVTGTVVLAYVAYLGASAFDFSGIFATAVAGVALRGFLKTVRFTRNKRDVDSFWTSIAFISNAIVFLITGLTLQLGRTAHEPLLILAVLFVVLAARALLAIAVSRDFAWRVTAFMAGIRGGLSLALALALPQDLPARAQIIDAVFAVVIFTLIVQGSALEPILRRLDFQSGSGGPSLSS